MVGFAFLGGLAATGIAIAVLFFYIRRRLRRFSSEVFGNEDLLRALTDLEVEQAPRSLNGCDSLLLPQILEDFPDFDPVMASSYVQEELTSRFGNQDSFTIHNIVIARYLPYEVQKTIVYQAAVSWSEDAETLQKRYNLHYTYMIESSSEAVAGNCPNCGGALGYGETECPYCGSRVSHVLGNCWKFTEVLES